MNQGQHIMAGVQAATQRYYGSKRKGKGRKLGRSLAAFSRAATQVVQAAQAWGRP